MIERMSDAEIIYIENLIGERGCLADSAYINSLENDLRKLCTDIKTERAIVDELERRTQEPTP